MEIEFNFSNYLKKFEKFLPYETRVRNCILSAIKEVFSINLDRKTVKISGFRVFIQTNSSLKSEILLKQSKLIEICKRIDPSLTIEKIQ